MRLFVLTALLLSAPAAAQGNAPATVPVSASAATLRVTAAVGTTVEMQTTTQSRMTMGKVEVTAAPGRQVSAAKLQAMQQEFSRGMAGADVPAMTGKLFVKVAARAADGSVTLLTSMIQNIPGEKTPLTLRVTQQVAPDGSITGLSMDSDHPMMKPLLSGLTPEKLRQIASQSGADHTGIYGLPLVKGSVHTQTATLDLQEIMSAVLQGIAGQDPEVAAALGDLKSSFLKTTTTTTYSGLNAQGLHTFMVSGRAGGYRMSLGGQGGLPAMTMELKNLQTSGSSTYRPDGLPGLMTQQSTMQMVMTMQMDDVVVTMPMTMTQTLTARPR
ncbi:hypothetical protein [Deinococcus deserti]|uniref:Uncharacterized protein n=1 Tax=Deinococcus deserti (strain DSM 17065 / CIP 109153 / LMG 22923 / VCD115) TaxID=546414 RepID=C1CYK6_DEIDV|nr:hypothetical protein [Deinococcus deserti]ACO45027.2 hypothetical protein Deide_02190 [Deinococcus deserti VCD115]